MKLFVVVLNSFCAFPTARHASFRCMERKECDNKAHLRQIDFGFKENATDWDVRLD